MSTTFQAPARVDVPGPQAPAPPSTPHIGFRADIEGLRAVAVVLVVLGHAGVGAVAGGYVGVDVFFVISGFLITTLLVKELNQRGRVSLAGFYARRAIRLLPAAALVLIVTLAAAFRWLPATRFRSISLDALFSTFYGINWRLAAEGTDYLNATATPSPLQHYWSLAVEEQFYLVWPLLLMAVWIWRGSFRHRTSIVVALSAIVAASLTASIWHTSTSAPWAYFGAHTRAWELAAGALVAMSAPWLARLPERAAAALTWAGLAAVLASALLYSSGTAFPGYAATLPVLGAATIIAGGTAGPRGGVLLLLGTWPFQQLGKLSYGWYLWHFPVLLIVPPALGLTPSVWLNLALVVFALDLARLTFHAVENPIHTGAWFTARTRRGLSLGVGLSASVAVLALVAGLVTPPVATGGPAIDTAVALAQSSDREAELIRMVAAAQSQQRLPSNLTPGLTFAAADVPPIYDDKCHLGYLETRQGGSCTYGDPAGRRTMYLVGDSHAAQWFPALDTLAKQRGYKLIALTKSGCQVPSVTVVNRILKRPYRECTEWRDQVLTRVHNAHPDLVVLSSNSGDEGGVVDSRGRPQTGDAPWIGGWAASIGRVRQTGTDVVVLSDTPWPKGSAPECAAAHTRNITACGRPVGTALLNPGRRDQIAAAATALGATVIDPVPWFCADSCPIVVGDLLVYRDDSHFTTAYAHLLTPILGERLKNVLG